MWGERWQPTSGFSSQTAVAEWPAEHGECRWSTSGTRLAVGEWRMRVWEAGVAGADHGESTSFGERNLVKLVTALCKITPRSIPARFLAGRIFGCARRDS